MTRLEQLRGEYMEASAAVLNAVQRKLDPGTIDAAVIKATSLRERLLVMEGDESMRGAIRGLTNGMHTAPGGNERRPASLGAQFIASDTFKYLNDNRGKLPQGVWTSPSSELLLPGMMAATLSEDSVSGGQLIVTDYQPGIVQLPQRPLRLEQLLGSGTTDSNTIGYMRETAFTNAATAVAEGAPKPESTLVFDATTDPVRKVPHWIPVTDEMLEDVAGMRSYIDGRLVDGVNLTTDDQLLNGNGTAPNLTGLLHRSGLTTTVTRSGSVTNADAILDQIVAIELATNLAVDGIVMNPANWKTIIQSKNGDGDYYGGGPLAAPARPVLWGRPVAVTTAIAAGTALPGAFRTAAQVFNRGGIRVEASNSHNDFFVRNLTAIRAERRLALAVYRASGFGKVDGLN